MHPQHPTAVPPAPRVALAAVLLTLAGCGGGDPVATDQTEPLAGDRIAFLEGPLSQTGATPAGGRTVLVSVATGARRVLDDTLVPALGVRASPDGRSLIYLMGAGGFRGTLWRRDLATNALAQVPERTATRLTQLLRWRADGWVEGICVPEPNRELHLCLVRADGSASEVLPPPVPVGGTAALSPDGTRIAVTFDGFDSQFGLLTGIRLVARDGSDPRTVVPAGVRTVIEEIAWSPDGTRLLYVRRSAAGGAGAPRINVVRPDGTDRRELLAGDQKFGQQYAEWTPDGTRVTFVQTPYYFALADLSAFVELLPADSAAAPTATVVTPERGVHRWSPTWVRRP